MASNSELQMVSARSSWLGGFSNMLGKENRHWWGTRYWLVQLILWLIIINGIITAVYMTPIEDMVSSDSGNTAEADQATLTLMKQNPELVGLIPFMRLGGLVMAVGVVILAQGIVITEKQSGTAAWVLSKPISRSAFILSKLAGYGLGILCIMCFFIGAVLYGQIRLFTGVLMPLPSYLGMLGLVFLNLLFYLTLSIMLGTIFNSRGVVIGIPLLLLFSPMIIPDIPAWLVAIMPWNLVNDFAQPALALSVVQGQPIQSITPLVATALWCVVFIGISIWRFQREEF